MSNFYSTGLLEVLERHKDTLMPFGEVCDWVPGVGADSVREALDGLVVSGRVHHPTGDLYWCGTMTRLGPVPPRIYDVVMKVYVEVLGVGYAGLDAINRMHLSTQVTAREMYAVPFLVEDINITALRLVDRSDRAARNSLGFFEVTLLEVLGASDEWEVREDAGLARLAQLVKRSGVTLAAEPLRLGAADEPGRSRELLEKLLTLVYG